jgi:A/G-specific adenine glycosylase
MTVSEFQHTVTDHYRNHGRSFPWRETRNPYAITVSELMLQQTQADRVVPKYQVFLAMLPTWEALAETDTVTLLSLWQGLGYNRRALNLKRLAEKVTKEFQGELPKDDKILRSLPGIGPYTAGAIRAFAYNEPVVIIETNIRRAFLHHFFNDRKGISDGELMPLIEQAVNTENPREWYYALMDYGSWLAKQYPNANRRSKHYTKQSKFTGSLRQLRGEIVRFVTAHPTTTVTEILQTTGQDPGRVEEALAGLERDGFITRTAQGVQIAS